MVQLYRRKADDRLVNTTTIGGQHDVYVAALKNGGFVAVWTDNSLSGGDNRDGAIKAQLFDANGDKVGGQFLVNTTITDDQHFPTVATLNSGRFVVTWTDARGDGSEAIKGQIFEANGTRVGSEFRINTQTSGDQEHSQITALAGGGFVVTWHDTGTSIAKAIKAQVFDAAGAAVGGEILVDSQTQGVQREPSLIALPGGGFAIVWESDVSANVDESIRLQLFDSAGAKVGGEQIVNADIHVMLQDANIALLDNGFLVTWSQQDAGSRTSFDLRGQRFDFNGAKVGAEFLVSKTDGFERMPAAHSLPGGGFIVTWGAAGEGLGHTDIFGQVFDAAGAKQGPTFLVTTITDQNQLRPVVDVLASGDIVIVWDDVSKLGGDADQGSVKYQILTLSNTPATDIVLSGTEISETAREGVPLIALETIGALNSFPTYTIVSDSTGGAFGIVGDSLVVTDHSLLDFETDNQVEVRLRTTDENGLSYEETVQLTVTDVPEDGYQTEGDEFLVNTTTQDNQTQPVVAALDSGGYVAVWSQFPLGGGAITGKAQIYDSAGNKVGGELAVRGDDVLGLPGGGFVTTWIEDGGTPLTTTVKAQMYDSAGNPVGAQISVQHAFNQAHHLPTLTLYPPSFQSPTGGFLITWAEGANDASSLIYAQGYKPTGEKLFFFSLQASTWNGADPEAATLDNGDIVIVWTTVGGPITAQMYDTDSGERFGLPFEVSTLNGAIEPHVTALAGGGFVVTYMGSDLANLSGQIFDSEGHKVGTEFLISANGATRFDSADVTALPWGGFIVTWSGQEDGDPLTNDAGTRARIFDATGEPLGPEMAVNQATPGDQIQTTVAVLASGEIVVGWADASGQGGDSSGYSIKARLLDLVAFDNSGNDTINGNGSDNMLDGGPGDDRLFGNGGSDTLIGGPGNDLLDGGPGADTMTGGTGNDVYYVDDAGDVVVENPGEGTDEIRTSLDSYSLVGTNVENLTATTNTPHDLRGSADDNVVAGAGGNDLLRLNDGGNDTANGGAGNDILYFGSAFTGADIADGGDGRDVLVLQGNYTLTLSATNIANLESISLQSGARTTWGDTANNFYDYNITMADENTPAGVQLIVNGQSLRAGEDFTFDGSAETDGKFLVYGGNGVDHFTGGAGNDVFFFEGDRWGSSDTVNGGAGRDALIISSGTGLAHIEFGASSLTSIESISVNARFATDPSARPSYELVLDNGNVAPGAALILNASSLTDPIQTVLFDGSAVQDGVLIMFGGAGSDVLIGGDNADSFEGKAGVDRLTGGAGADIFRYTSVADSDSATPDQILDFASGSDKIDLSAIDADGFTGGDQAFHWIGAEAFSAQGSASAGELRAWLFDGSWYVEGDVNGDGFADLVIQVTMPAAPVVESDFVL